MAGILAAVLAVAPGARDKGKDTPEASAAATTQPRATREMTERAFVALERK